MSTTSRAHSLRLAASSNASGEAFNVATGIETSLTELADALLTAMGADVTVEYGPLPHRQNCLPRRVADTRRARARLGFIAEVPLAEGLGRLVKWWRQTQRWNRRVLRH